MDKNVKCPEKCLDEAVIAGYLSGRLTAAERGSTEEHLSRCAECRSTLVSTYESVAAFKKGSGSSLMKKMNWYCLAMAVSFTLSFLFPRYFLQFLALALILGLKWIVDARTTKILVTIFDAWKRGGDQEAGRALREMEGKKRF